MATSRFDLVVLGAGPAGLAAATAAARAGRSVALLDGEERPGGQYWRHPARDLSARGLQHDLATFADLVREVRGRVTYLAGHNAWTASRNGHGFSVHATCGDREVAISGRTLVLATGSHDRSLPFPGWDLPGVFTAGGAQALVKGHGVVPGRRVVVGGTGPFLLPVAAALASRDGVTVAGVFEANRPTRWLGEAAAVGRSAGKLAEAAGYFAALARRRVPYRTRRAIVAAHGDDRVEAVTVTRIDRWWRVVPGTARTVDCDAVAVGWGFVPRLELPLALGCGTRVDADGSLIISVDGGQATDVPGVFAAGEVCGVGGADLAVVEGEIAGLVAAEAPAAGARLGRLRRRRAALRDFAAGMHRVHPVRDGWKGWLRPDTIVCRCEEVPAAEIAHAVADLGAVDARSAKLMTRAGMGWCQARVCGYAAAHLTAVPGHPADQRGTAERPVAFPVPLGMLARSSADRTGHDGAADAPATGGEDRA